MVMNSISRLSIIVGLLYMTTCAGLYIKQESLLFPRDIPAPMSHAWKPSATYPHEEMKLVSNKGTLYGVLWRAPNAKGTVLYCHGNAENIGVSQMFVPQFIDRGYNVLIWDYRGYGLSTGELGNQESLLADAESVYQWLQARIGTGEIAFYGRSLGSGFAVYLGNKHPGHKVLLEAAYDSLSSVAQDHYPMFPAMLLLKYPMPSIAWAKGIPTKIYMIHGTDDHVIPPEHPEALAKAAPNASLTMVQGLGHNGLSYSKRYAEWLEKAL
jgi:hypothetical protein